MKLNRFFNKSKKIIASFVLIGFLIIQFGAVSIPPRKAEAIIPVFDMQSWMQFLVARIEENWKEWMLQYLKQFLLKKVVKTVQSKDPTFVKNWTDWIRKHVGDKSLDELNDILGVNLCAHIRPQVILELKKYAEGADETDESPAECSLYQFLDNVDETFDYLVSGDWAVFDESIAANNTEAGVYLTGILYIDDVKEYERTVKLEELVANEGYVGQVDENGDVVYPGILESTARKETDVKLAINNILSLDKASTLSATVVDWMITYFNTNWTTGIKTDL